MRLELILRGIFSTGEVRHDQKVRMRKKSEKKKEKKRKKSSLFFVN